MAACENLATKAELREKADREELNPIVEKAAAAGATALIAKDLASGSAQWINVKGAYVAQKLPELTAKTSSLDVKATKAAFEASLAGKNASKAISAGTSAASKATQALGAVSGVTAIIGTLATTAAVAALTKQVVELRKDFSEERIKNNNRFVKLQQTADSANNRSLNNEKEILSLQFQANELEAKISEVKHQTNLNKTQLDQLKKEIAGNKSNFEAQIDSINQRINAINQQNLDAAEAQRIRDTVNDLARQVSTIGDVRQTINRANDLANRTNKEVESLKPDIQANTNTRTRLLTGYEVIKAQQNIVNDTITDITSQIDQVKNSQAPNIDAKIDQKIQQQVPPLIDKLVPNNQPQFDSVNNQLQEIILALGLVPLIWDKVKQKTPRLTCQAPTLVPPVGRQVQVAQGITIAQNELTRQGIGGLSRTISGIKTTVNAVKKTLDETKQFMERAWSFTKMDKVLNVLNLAVNLHNATMLSRDIGSTLGEAVSNALAFVGIKDAQGEFIDVNEVISNGVTNLITSIVGTENYQAILTQFAKANRIYQTGMNLLSNLRSVLGSMEEIAEQTGTDVAQIGNALRDSGTVEADSYPHMAENRRGLIKVFDALEKGEELADSVLTITEEVKDISEESSDFKDNLEEIRSAFKEEKEEITRIEEVADRRIESLPELTEEDKLESIDN